MSPSVIKSRSDGETSGAAAGAAVVGVGLTVLGLSSTAYLVIAGRALSPADFAVLATFWTLTYTFGPGCFLAFEQEVARALSTRLSRGDGGRPVIVRALQAAGILLAPLLVALMAGAPLLADSVLGGRTDCLPLLAAMIGMVAGQHLLRGILAGGGHLAGYSAQLFIEGAVRITGSGVLLLAGVSSLGVYAGLLVVAALAGLLATVSGVRPAIAPGSPATWPDIAPNFGWLVLAGLCTQAMANGAVVIVQVLAEPHQEAQAGLFLAALVVARVPLFAFQAIQAVLIPNLTRALVRKDFPLYQRELRRVLAGVAAVGGAGVLGTAMLGVPLIGLAFGEGFDVGRGNLVLLSVSTALFLVALVFQSALVAMGDHRGNALGWAAGLATMAGCAAVPANPVTVAEIALVLGCVSTTFCLGVRLALATRRPLSSDLRETTTCEASATPS